MSLNYDNLTLGNLQNLFYGRKMNLLNNRYRIENSLGTGGMGEVYKGYDIHQNKPVAIKRLKESHENSRKRFHQEYRFLNTIHHPSLVKAYDCFEIGTEICMILEFVEGKTLKELLTQTCVFSLAEQLAIANKISRGVEVLNKGGVIHRDIKPDNIMVNRNRGTVKILDLGIGKALNQNTQLTLDGDVLGTIPYMSPEQANGRISEQSDVFSLGTTLYQFFCWEKNSPFYTGENIYLVLHRIGSYDPPPLVEILGQQIQLTDNQKTIYMAISTAVMQAMMKEPGRRWANAGDLADQFEEIFKLLLQLESLPETNSALLEASSKIDKRLLKDLEEIRDEYQESSLQETTLLKANSDEKTQKISKKGKSKKTKFSKKEKSLKKERTSEKLNIHTVYGFAMLLIVFISYHLAFYQAQQISKSETKDLLEQLTKLRKEIANLKSSKSKSSMQQNSFVNTTKQNSVKKPKKRPSEAKKYLQFARDSINQRNFPQALRYFNRAIELNENYATAYANRGVCYYNMGNMIGAIKDYNKALELGPKSATTYCNRAVAKERLNQIKEAIDDYNQAIKLNPKYSNAYFNRGICLAANGDAIGAMQDYNRVIEIEPTHTKALYNRGLLKEKRGNINSAIDDYTKSLKIDPRKPNVYASRGVLLKRIGRHREALADLRAFLKLVPHHPEAHKIKALIQEIKKSQ